MKRIFTVIVLAAVLSAFALGVCGCSAGGGVVERVNNSISYCYTPADTSSRFFCNAKQLEDKLGGEVEAFLTCDGTVGIARVGTGLYRIDENGVLMVHPAGVDRALLSLDSTKIVFTTATEVHIYDHVTGAIEDVKPEGISSVLSIVLSPDGGTVGYSVRYDDGSIRAYSYSRGQSRRLSDNAYIIGIADGAEYWYYLTPGADLYYASGKRDKKLGAETADMFDFNIDLSEVVFDMNGVTYMSVNGGSAKRLVDGASLFTTAGSYFSTQGGADSTAHVRNCSTMTNCVYYTYGSDNNEDNPRSVYSLWYVNSLRRATKLAGGAYQFSISENGDRLACLVDETVYSMDITDPGTAKPVCYNVYSYLAASDLGSYYCIGYDRKLYYIAGGAQPRELLDGAVYSVMTAEGKCLCLADYNVTGTLYYIDGLAQPQAVKKSVYIVETAPGICRCYSAPYKNDAGNEVYDLYVSPDGREFSLALEGIKLYTD